MSKFTDDELIFMCSMSDKIGAPGIAMMINKNENEILQKIWYLKKTGTFKYYKKLGGRKVKR